MTTKPKAYFRLFPDGTIYVALDDPNHPDGSYPGKTLASWRSANRSDATNKEDEGGVYDFRTKERWLFNNKKDWIVKVRELYTVSDDKFTAESWRGGGMWHQGRLSDSDLYSNAKRSRVKIGSKRTITKRRLSKSSPSGMGGLR